MLRRARATSGTSNSGSTSPASVARSPRTEPLRNSSHPYSWALLTSHRAHGQAQALRRTKPPPAALAAVSAVHGVRREYRFEVALIAIEYLAMTATAVLLAVAWRGTTLVAHRGS